ncbi:hypothetical protein D3C87_2207780 [compost metagenome]
MKIMVAPLQLVQRAIGAQLGAFGPLQPMIGGNDAGLPLLATQPQRTAQRFDFQQQA